MRAEISKAGTCVHIAYDGSIFFVINHMLEKVLLWMDQRCMHIFIIRFSVWLSTYACWVLLRSSLYWYRSCWSIVYIQWHKPGYLHSFENYILGIYRTLLRTYIGVHFDIYICLPYGLRVMGFKNALWYRPILRYLYHGRMVDCCWMDGWMDGCNHFLSILFPCSLYGI